MINRVPATSLSHRDMFNYVNDIISFSFWPDNIALEVMVFIGCQFALESNFGRSRLATINNNHCGMKIPRLRPNYNISDSGEFSAYPSLEYCVLDYFVWLVWSRFTMSELNDIDKFKVHLQKSSYCPDEDYISRINNLYCLLLPLFKKPDNVIKK